MKDSLGDLAFGLRLLPQVHEISDCLGFEEDYMGIDVLADPESVARKAAGVIAAEARAAFAARGRFVVAISGGHTPWIMLRDLAHEDIPGCRAVRSVSQCKPMKN